MGENVEKKVCELNLYNKISKKLFVIVLFALSAMLLSVVSVFAVNCWEFDDSSTQCTTAGTGNECQWHTDPWGSWCEQKGCWNFFSSAECAQANNASSSLYLGKACSWQTSATTGWCSNLDCWTFNGNQTGCTLANTTYGLKCWWDEAIDQWGSPCSGPPDKKCWDYSTEATCTAVSGCMWGFCNRVSCWDQNTQAACTATTGYNGKACSWKS